MPNCDLISPQSASLVTAVDSVRAVNTNDTNQHALNAGAFSSYTSHSLAVRLAIIKPLTL